MKPISLKLQNITKSFYGKKLFENFSFEFTPGIYAICGANGIGKSTLLHMMTGSTLCDAGDIIINGVDLRKHPVQAKMHISYIPDQSGFYPFIKGREFINFILAIKKSLVTNETQSLIDKLGLECYMHTSFSDMSLGTQKKFMMLAATIGNPSIIMMDEPTNALEQSAREFLTEYLLSYANTKILLTTTHDMQFIKTLNAKTLLLEKQPIHSFSICSKT